MMICLDAGHYGNYNRSPAVGKYYESRAMWQLQKYLKEELESRGFSVKTTRSDPEKDMGLTDRGRAAKGCDLLLSLHSNAVGSRVDDNTDYVAVYHLTADKGTSADDRSKELAQKIAPVIAGVMGVNQGSKVLSRLAKTDKNKDGALNDNYYGVLNGARQVNVPALILEHSFHTNTRAANYLLQEENLKTLARAEAEVIAAFLKTGEEVTYTMELKTLKKGMKGENVRALQILLSGRGIACDPDGSFGPATDQALRSYQQQKGLTVDGKAGPATMKSLLGVG